MILDTNALSAFAGGDQALAAVLERATAIHLPVIVLGEFRYGLKRSRGRRLLERWLNERERDFVVLETDRHTARCYADVREELRHGGTPIPENDVWIAALALQHHLPVVSRDRHFDVVSGVKRIGW